MFHHATIRGWQPDEGLQMGFQEALNVLRVTIHVTAREPFGLAMILAFVVGALGRVVLQGSDHHPRLSTAMFLLTCGGALGFGFAAAGAQRRLPPNPRAEITVLGNAGQAVPTPSSPAVLGMRGPFRVAP